MVSVFLGDELTAILEALETDTAYAGVEKKKLKLGVDVLPHFLRDTTDRNRTSPFAFTGNKFEFRMLGSSNSIACANIMLNTAVAESLRQYADELESASDLSAALHDLIQRVIRQHKRIIFNGNGYDDAWIQEATEKRGLLNLRTTPDAIPMLVQKDNMAMLVRHKVFTESELRSRYEIQLENYCKTVRIEALTMVDMARKEMCPTWPRPPPLRAPFPRSCPGAMRRSCCASWPPWWTPWMAGWTAWRRSWYAWIPSGIPPRRRPSSATSLFPPWASCGP